MQKVIIVDSEILDGIVLTQNHILQKIKNQSANNEDLYISGATAAQKLDCDKQTIVNFEKEGLINKYGRGKFVRYSLQEIEKAMGINQNQGEN